jgi:competence protein ComEC
MNQKRRRTLFILFCLAIVIFIAFILIPEPAPAVHQDAHQNGSLDVLVIDVAQGDSILVTLDTGETMLIDAGDTSNTTAIREELDERSIRDIDILVATHPHADHIGGMTEIIEHYHIGMVYMPDKTSESKTYKTLEETINDRNIPLVTAYAGLSFDLGGALCTIVSPEKEADESANNESVAIFLDYEDTEFLFTGDMETKAENAVLAGGYYIDADVLKVAHHGSSSSTSGAFLDAVTPEYAVISCGEGNSYGHPHQETCDALSEFGANVLRTDQSGDILFISDGYNIEIALGD